MRGQTKTLMTKSILTVIILLFLAFGMRTAAAEPADQLLAAGRIDDAIRVLQTSISSSPNGASSYNLLCRAFFTMGNWDQAIAACEKGVSLDPQNSLYHLSLGRAYGEKAEHTNFMSAIGFARKLRNEFETAVRLDPGNVAARTDLAEFYLEAPGFLGGGTDKAVAQSQQLMPLDPVKGHWVLGRIAEKRKDSVTAESEYRKAIQAGDGRGDAWLNLALFYRHNGRFDAMEEALDHIRSTDPGHPNAMMEAAQLLIRTGRNTPAAIDLLQRYLASSTVEEAPAFQAHYLLGTLLEKRGDRQAAAREYQTSLSLARSFTPAQSALARLKSPLAHSG
jgi:tetratricopeptide (TPR) repeat protein